MTTSATLPRGRAANCPACGTPCSANEPCPSCGRAPAKERLGSVLAGRYRLEKVIGRGGFGVVYQAYHLGLKQVVAVKFLLAEWARMAESRLRFEREAAALVRLRHPGIVAAYDFGEDDGDLYLVMEWVPGKDLASQIVVDGKLMSNERLVAIFDQVLAVLEAAHAQGLVHRDLKPENVMVLEGDRVKVLDFGLVLITDAGGKRLTASNAVQGTCYYMSPEQCRGRDVGPPADVYAIGVMLFEMLTGEPPFLAETSVEVMMQQLMLEPPKIAERGVMKEPHPGLEAIVRACLAKNPDARPTVTQLRKDLAAVLRGEDAVTQLETNVKQRVAAQALSRGERAIGSDQAGKEARAAKETHVIVWGFAQADADRVRGALAMQGVTGDHVGAGRAGDSSHAELPELGDARAVIVAGDIIDTAVERVTQLRAKAPKLPILVASVTRADATPALIRAGASDVTLATVGDDVLAQKVLRLIRRKR